MWFQALFLSFLSDITFFTCRVPLTCVASIVSAVGREGWTRKKRYDNCWLLCTEVINYSCFLDSCRLEDYRLWRSRVLFVSRGLLWFDGTRICAPAFWFVGLRFDFLPFLSLEYWRWDCFFFSWDWHMMCDMEIWCLTLMLCFDFWRRYFWLWDWDSNFLLWGYEIRFMRLGFNFWLSDCIYFWTC